MTDRWETARTYVHAQARMHERAPTSLIRKQQDCVGVCLCAHVMDGHCRAVIKGLWSRALSAVITLKVRSFNILWHWQQPSDRHLISCSFVCARLQIPVQFVTEPSDSWVQRLRVRILRAKCMSSCPWDWSGNTNAASLPLLTQSDWTASLTWCRSISLDCKVSEEEKNTCTVVKLSSSFLFHWERLCFGSPSILQIKKSNKTCFQ